MTHHPTGRLFAWRVAVTLALAAALAVALLAAGQSTQPPPAQQEPQRPTFRTEANLVRVDAFPTRDGLPVLDLSRDEFQVFEDGVPQSIQSFEHVVIDALRPQAERVEPNTQRDGNAMAADPHNRVFVIFLDAYHVSVEGSYRIARPLIDLIDRVLAPDDLVGVVTPQMDVTDLILARKTDVIARGLTESWTWGRRHGINLDDEEEYYARCYPALEGERGSISELAWALIQRRREKITLDTIQDLVRYLDGLREERKAIITVSDGWLLFRESPGLMTPRPGDPLPAGPQIYVSPRGTLTSTDERGLTSPDRCEADRQMLAYLDNERYFRDILRSAQQSNAAFYTIDPRGLAAFDSPIGPQPPPPLSVDLAMLRARADALRTLSANTGGVAVLNSNDLTGSLRQIVEDLRSYYLLGYYSSNTALDGKYRRIEVKVRRPGVEVRARDGYHAASAEEVARGVPASAPAPAAEREAADAAIAGLSAVRFDTPLLLGAVPLRSGRATEIRIVGEIPAATIRDAAWRQGGRATILVTGTAGATLGMARATLRPGERTFDATVPLDGETAGECRIQVRLSPDGAGAPVGEVLRVVLPPPGQPPPVLGAPMLFRRSAGPAGPLVPTADPRFRRTESARVDVPATAGASGVSARLLDRTGEALNVPVTIGERVDDRFGQRWLSADVTLAPLTTGDYLVELTASEQGASHRVLVALRVRQ